jgi:hypothetical protein
LRRTRFRGESARCICLGLLAACVLALGISASANATPLSYTFDSGNQGWEQNQDQSNSSTLEPAGFEATGGNPGGHLDARDTGSENGCPNRDPCELLTFYSPIVTPLSANYDGLASFDLRSSATPTSSAEVWLLAAGNNYLDGFLPSPTGTDFNHFSIPLNETANWRICPYSGGSCPRPTQQQFKDLIGATDQLAVMVDIAAPGSDGMGETYYLDNVNVTEPAPTPTTPVTPTKKCKKTRHATGAKKKCKKKGRRATGALRG